jgi:hypothetical protein
MQRRASRQHPLAASADARRLRRSVMFSATAARRVVPARLALKSPEGSGNAAPLAKVSFTTDLYVSPVQMMPACDHTGTPRGFDGFLD